ncbi:oleate hydratase [Actinospica sp. MGRD01-02]|uniref:Oleate hydratase n=1 Tax=Actinospica acidithermotolerans TaxID=2828514 RepID=A0A941E702_9ACTN|nr:oleate hydratase [Actinospica acidithermotolerans]MBR7825617.1 oleate hydratase [Actinospica acidithermotolerans]
MDGRPADRFLLVGGGIASLAAAAFLIRDGGVPGRHIRILEAADRPGGALVSGHAPGHPTLYVGAAVRGVDEREHACLWNLLGSVPTLADPSRTPLDEMRAAERRPRTALEARLVDADHRVARPDLRLGAADRAALRGLLDRSDARLAETRIDQAVPAHLLAGDFWLLCTTVFRLRPASSALDLKRALLLHLPDLRRLPVLPTVHRTRRSEYDSIVRPLYDWLRCEGVAFTFGTTVTDMPIASEPGGGRRATALTCSTRGREHTIELGGRDRVLVTLGSMAANASHGDDENPPAFDATRRDPTWRLWESVARHQPDLGRPEAFTSHVEDTAWLSFTLTTTTSDLTWFISHLTGDPDGGGGPVTFRDSPWLLTLTVPRQPHFTGQLPHTHTVLGYGMRLATPGAHTSATMLRATGRQLLDETIGQLGLERRALPVRMNTNVRSIMLPYAGSPLATRRPGDRPEQIPPGARNFAFLGQYVEIPGALAFSMEYSVRSAMRAVYALLGIDRELPGADELGADTGRAGDLDDALATLATAGGPAPQPR